MKLEDLKIEAIDPQPKGGQHVGMPIVAIRATHIPTKLSATCETERSQSRNKNVAISMIEWGLSEIGWRDL